MSNERAGARDAGAGTDDGLARAATGDDGLATSGNSFLGDVWVNFKRWNVKAVRNPFILVVSLVQPVVFLVLFTEVFGNVATGAINQAGGGVGGVSYETYLVPAIAIQVSLIAAASSGIGLVNDIENGMFEKVLATPMNRAAVFVGKTAAELLRIVVQIIIILGLGVLLGANVETGVVGAVGIVCVGLLFSLWFLSLSNVIAVVTKDQESTIIGANLVQFPLLFVSTAFLPLAVLPDWIQTVAKVNPITYGVDAARAIMLGRDVMTVVDVAGFDGMWHTLVPAVAVLVALDLVLGGVAVFMLSRATSSDVQ